MRTSARKRLRRVAVWGVKALLLGLGLWLVWRLLAGLRWEDLTRRVEGASLPWLGVALVALVVRFGVWDERWRRAVRRLGKLPPRRVSGSILMTAVAVNTITPTVRLLGGVLRARYLARALGETAGRAYGSVLYDQVIHQTTGGLLTWLALIAAAAVTGRETAAAVLALALAATLASLLWWLWWSGRRQGRTWVGLLADRMVGKALGDDESDGDEAGRFRRLVAHGRDAVVVVRGLLADRRLHGEAFGLGVLFLLVNGWGQWAVFRALGEPVSYVVVLAVVALGVAAGAVVGTPGGVGGAEAAMIAGFAAFGVDGLDAAAGALLFRVLHFLTILVLGVPCLLWLEGRYGGPPTDDAG